MLLLTEPKHPPRSGPPSAFYEPGRGNLLAEALLARGHRVVMWWDHPVGPMVPADPGVVALRSSHPVQLARAEVFARMGVPVVNDPVAHRRARDKLHQHEVLGAAGLLVPETTGAGTATARWHGNDLVVVKPRVVKPRVGLCAGAGGASWPRRWDRTIWCSASLTPRSNSGPRS